MGKYVLIGVSAGLTSALLYAAVITGSPLAALLFYTAPLPVLLAGLGWGVFVALVAALAGALALAILVSPLAALFFFLMSAAPSAYVARLALLSRPLPDGSGIEWYPVGRIIAWAALFGGIAVVATIPMFGFDIDAYRDGLARVMRAMIAPEGGEGKLPEGVDVDRLVGFFSQVLPIFGAVLWMVTELLNLWLAARIVNSSGRLSRPWPRLSRIEFPPLLPVAFVLAAAGSFLGGIVGFIASVFAATFGLAFVLLGLAVLHEVTRGSPARPFILGITYLLLVIFSWIALALAALGLGETFLRLRDRRPPGGRPSST
ncbi:MAG: DUF2232 domain-containing protein [Hyphomicrobiales bacterium]